MKTLEEKLIPYVYCYMGSGMLSDNYDYNIAKQNSEKCALIAEDFAIGFAKWCAKYKELNSNLLSKYDDVFLIEELLEIYKKEKGLC